MKNTVRLLRIYPNKGNLRGGCQSGHRPIGADTFCIRMSILAQYDIIFAAMSHLC